jgi:glucose/arabinose dehydrogenase
MQWSNENSLDDTKRNGVDVHMNNPGEELNYHGLLNDTKSPQFGANYGYPLCIVARDPTILPANTEIQIGTQFVYGTVGGTNTDASCADKLAPRLTFPAHTAPIDLKFTATGNALYITFHGSW